MSDESDKEALGNITLGIDGVISFGTAFAEDTLGARSELFQGFSKFASKANFAIGLTTVVQATVQGGGESGLNAAVSLVINTAKGAFAGAIAGLVTGKNPYAIAAGTIWGGVYGQEAVEKFVAQTSLSNIFADSDGIFDPVGDKIAELQEQFPDVPLEAVTAVTMTAIDEYTSNANPWGPSTPEVQANWIFDPDLPMANGALQDTLQAMQDYYGYYGADLPPPPAPPPADDDKDKKDDKDEEPATAPPPEEPVVVTPPPPPGVYVPPTRRWKPEEIDVTVPPDPSEWDDGNGGATIPLILDLDGDGVEVAFGEDIYFDMDDDGFLEQTSWAAADDGFLVIDLNADGTRGAGDNNINQSNELVLSSLGHTGLRCQQLETWAGQS